MACLTSRADDSTAWVMKTRSPQTIGVESPRSGGAARLRAFSFVLQRSGSFVSRQIPLPPAPRHAGQFSVSPANVEAAISKVAAAWSTGVSYAEEAAFYSRTLDRRYRTLR